MSVLRAETAWRVQQRAAAIAEVAHLDMVANLIDEWADLQTERLMREILGRPVMFYRRERALDVSPRG